MRETDESIVAFFIVYGFGVSKLLEWSRFFAQNVSARIARVGKRLMPNYLFDSTQSSGSSTVRAVYLNRRHSIAIKTQSMVDDNRPTKIAYRPCL